MTTPPDFTHEVQDPEPPTPPASASDAERDAAAMAWLAWYWRTHHVVSP